MTIYLRRRVLLAEVAGVVRDLRRDIGLGGPCQPQIDQVLENIAARIELILPMEDRHAIARRILARLQDQSEPDPLDAVQAVLEDEGVV